MQMNQTPYNVYITHGALYLIDSHTYFSQIANHLVHSQKQNSWLWGGDVWQTIILLTKLSCSPSQLFEKFNPGMLLIK